MVGRAADSFDSNLTVGRKRVEQVRQFALRQRLLRCVTEFVSVPQSATLFGFVKIKNRGKYHLSYILNVVMFYGTFKFAG